MPRTKSAPRYWVKKNGLLYARLQFPDDAGKRREKYRRITDKRKARSVVEQMRRELEDHGSDALDYDRMTFIELAKEYTEARVVPAVIVNGVKVSGLRSHKSVLNSLKPLRRFFGRKHIRSIKVKDIEKYQAQIGRAHV